MNVKPVLRIGSLIAVMALLPLVALGQNWQVGVGVSFRDFDDVEFKGFGPAGVPGLTLLEQQDLVVPYSADLIEGIPAGWVNIVEVGGVVASFGGMDEGIDSSDGISPIVSAELPIWAKDKLSLNVVMNLQWYNVDVSSSSSLSVSSTALEYQYWVQNGVLFPEPRWPEGSPYGAFAAMGTVDSDFEMDLYEIDLGLKLIYTMECALECFVAAGPTLNIVDMDSSMRAEVMWEAPGGAGMLGQTSESDSDTDIIIGGYISAGGQYWFNEQYGISLEARYDAALDEAETDHAEVDLDGLSGQAKFMIRF